MASVVTDMLWLTATGAGPYELPPLEESEHAYTAVAVPRNSVPNTEFACPSQCLSLDLKRGSSHSSTSLGQVAMANLCLCQ